jgi:putative flippase GtrA
VRFTARRPACAPTLSPVSAHPRQAWPTGTVTPARPARRAPDHRRPTSLLEQVGLARLLSGARWLLLGELAKFAIVGVLAVLIAGVGTNVLHFQVGVGPLTSNVIATAVATAVSYVGNRYWTFRHRQRTNVGREGIVFFVLNGIGLAIQLACLGLCTYVLGLHDRLSYNVFLVIGIGLATVFRYGAYKKWVWRAQLPAQPSPGASAR